MLGGAIVLDIYSAGTSIKKLLTYVEDIADSKPRMYEKSKDRLKEIATTCNKVVEVISEILEDEVLKEDSVEFGQNSDLTAVITNMQQQMDKLKQFAEGASDDSDERHVEINSSSSKARKKALKSYSSCLSKLSTIETAYPFANRCAKLLWTWFDVRFLKTVYGTNFRYNMKKFPEWIQSIVILYGKAIHDNDVASFEANFQAWLQSIINTDAKDKYAVPYDIYQLSRNMNSESITLDAVILWDILLDNGLRDVCTTDKDDLYMDEYDIYNLADTHSPAVLDSYCNYATHPEVFELLDWEVMTSE